MKYLSIIFLILFSFLSVAKADDIKDFQIEGIAVGDSLLDYMTENEIISSKRNYVKNKRYYVVGSYKNLKNYDTIDIYLKTGDKNYTVRSLGGILFLKKKECLIKKKEIVNDLRSLFETATEESYDNEPHSFDKSGKTKIFQTVFNLYNDPMRDQIKVDCTDWSKKIEKKSNWKDNLSVQAISSEIMQWFAAGYN